MKKFIFLFSSLFVFSLFFSHSLNAQNQNADYTVKVVQPAYFDISPPLRDMQPIKDFIKPKQRTGNNKVVNNHFRGDGTPPAVGFKDPVRQTQYNFYRATANVLHNFDGANNGDNGSGVAPPDTQGDVGPNHYVQAVNNVTEVFNKSGNSIWGPTNTSVFWDGFNGSWTGTNDGDPIILYDEDADRWLVTQFSVSAGDGTQWILIAVSTGSDPTGSYARYAYQFTDMPDYPKFGIWHDAYYMSVNRFKTSNSSYNGTSACAFNRAAMIAGNASATMIQIDNTAAADPYALLPADCDGSLPTGPGYFVYDTDNDTYWSTDDLIMCEFTPNWATPANSTFTQYSLGASSFNSAFVGGIDQPSTTDDLNVLNDRMMFRSQYRDFGTYESMVVSRSVNTGGDVSAIRWYELRRTSGNWFIYQEGTYDPGDGDSRWMPSIAINAAGDIALGYSVSGASTYPSIRVTGRYASDPLNTMTITETEIYTGASSQTGVSRWGDYAMMSVDPTTDNFWFTTEYTSGAWNWKTRIAEFEFPAVCTPPTTQAGNFSATAIGDNQMTANWTRGNGNAVIVLAKEGSPVDAMPSSGSSYTDNATFGNGDEIGSGNFVVYDGTGNNVTVTGLTPGTTYYFAAFEYFSADHCYNTTGLTGNATTTGTAPCSPCYSWGHTTWETSTTLVQFNTINNSSAKPSDGNGNAYSDYTSISTDVLLNNSYDLTVNVNTDGNYLVESMVWIDWNQDCDFDDAGEEYYLGSAQNTANGPTTNSPLSITVPGTALTGNTVMRVSSQYDVVSTSCETDFDGEVEDYTINVISGSAPLIQTTVSSIDFGGVGIGYFSEQSYDVSGMNLTGNVTITAPAGFDISLTSGSGYTNSIVLTPVGGTLSATTIYVKFEPAAEQNYSGNITHVSTGASQVNVALNGDGINWFPAPINFAGILNSTDANLSWDPPATNASATNWYDYTDVANAASFIDTDFFLRGSFYSASDLGYTYPIKVTELRHSFFDFGLYNGNPSEWTDATFKFVIYAEDLTTLLYESPLIEAVYSDPFDYMYHTIPNGIILTGDFFMGIETVSADGYPSSLLAPITGANYHSYVFDGTDWFYFASSDFTQGLYIDGAKGGQYLTTSGQPNIDAKLLVEDSPVIQNSNPKSALTGYIVYRDGVDISGTLPSTQTNYTDANICGSYTYSATAVYTGYDGESNYSNSDVVDNPLPTAPTNVTANSTTICSGSSTTLSYSGGSGTTFVWYTGSCGGTQVGTGNNLSVSPTVQTPYYGRWENNCGVSSCQSVTINISTATAISTQPTGGTICQGDNHTFTVAATGSNLTYQWYKNAAAIGGATSASYAITNAAVGDAGNYYCQVSGTCGNVSSNTVSLAVNASTAITTQPTGGAICETDNFTFTVAATGSNLSYQWYKNSSAIGGATSASYSITNATAANAGSYYCVVSGDCGDVTSSTVSLVINSGTVITTQPTNETACAGDNVTFSVAATGSNLTYQWFKQSVSISGATSANYTINNISAADAANYYCEVSGDCGDVTSNTVSLTVSAATVITNQSNDQTACVGSNVTFSVTATGSNLTYQWFVDGSSIGGATSSSLSLTNVSVADEGVYTCEVSGDCGTVTTSDASLTITTSLTLGDPTNANVCPSATATFTVVANGTNLTYQWNKDGAPLSDGGDISGSNAATLSIANVDATDEASYTCDVTSDCGNASSNAATLTLNTATSITTEPTDAIACVTENVTFSVVADGSNLTYQWYKNTVSISGATSADYTISGITIADAGDFYCEVTGDCGVVTSNTVSLTVNDATSIATQPVGTTICEGTDYTLSVAANGGTLTYQWYLDGSMISGANSADYEIIAATDADAGDYTCEVTGDCGIATSDLATVIVNPATSIITEPVNTDVCEGDNATFTVVAQGTNLTYQWYYNGSIISGATGTSYTINNVTAADLGDFYCVVSGDCGSVTSVTVSLTIGTGITIVEQPTDLSVCEGADAVFTVNATGSNLSYQWFFDGTIISGATDASYTVIAAAASDLGSYSCQITGDCGSLTTNSVSLSLLPQTSIITQPVSVTDAQVGTTVVFTVVANGSNLMFQWFKDAASIADAITDTYTIENVTVDDQGDYNVEVTGDCGMVTSENAILTVITELQTIIDLGLNVYPNPTNGRFVVSFDNIVSDFEMMIFDETGRTVYYGQLNENYNQINIGNQAPGVYIMKIYNQTSSKTVKIVIK
ncbi:MAG: immunoglobulin domain-containing protein [Bacteroidales bacterium]|nr:immunoglobulin domain-containing protein [Bacteroidales bacterium]